MFPEITNDSLVWLYKRVWQLCEIIVGEQHLPYFKTYVCFVKQYCYLHMWSSSSVSIFSSSNLLVINPIFSNTLNHHFYGKYNQTQASQSTTKYWYSLLITSIILSPSCLIKAFRTNDYMRYDKLLVLQKAFSTHQNS